MNNILYKELSDRIIGLALTVHHVPGPGLLESAYQEALCRELKHADIPFERQKVYPLCYKGDYISAYIADLVIDNAVILELNDTMTAQLINYLKLSRIPVGYLINFQGIRLEWKRFVCKRE